MTPYIATTHDYLLSTCTDPVDLCVLKMGTEAGGKGTAAVPVKQSNRRVGMRYHWKGARRQTGADVYTF